MGENNNCNMKIVTGDAGYVLEDVPHLTDYIPDLPTYLNPLRSNPAYSVVKQYFVHVDDTVPQKIVVHKNSPRGTHFRRAGPRQKVYFHPDEVQACIVTCGGLCPGLNTVIREIVCGLSYMYGVNKVLGISIDYVEFERHVAGGSNMHYFDLLIRLKTEQEHLFRNIQRNEYHNLFDFISSKGLKILNLGSGTQTTDGVAAVLQNEDDETVDPHLERIRNEAGGDDSDEEEFVDGVLREIVILQKLHALNSCGFQIILDLVR